MTVSPSRNPPVADDPRALRERWSDSTVAYGLLLLIVAVVVIVALILGGPVTSQIFQDTMNLQGT